MPSNAYWFRFMAFSIRLVCKLIWSVASSEKDLATTSRNRNQKKHYYDAFLGMVMNRNLPLTLLFPMLNKKLCLQPWQVKEVIKCVSRQSSETDRSRMYLLNGACPWHLTTDEESWILYCEGSQQEQPRRACQDLQHPLRVWFGFTGPWSNTAGTSLQWWQTLCVSCLIQTSLLLMSAMQLHFNVPNDIPVLHQVAYFIQPNFIFLKIIYILSYFCVFFAHL